VQLILFLSIFSTSCICLKIRCDGECEKFCKIFWEVNKALECRCLSQVDQNQTATNHGRESTVSFFHRKATAVPGAIPGEGRRHHMGMKDRNLVDAATAGNRPGSAVAWALTGKLRPAPACLLGRWRTPTRAASCGIRGGERRPGEQRLRSFGPPPARELGTKPPPAES
jgi:hypothetical protein